MNFVIVLCMRAFWSKKSNKCQIFDSLFNHVYMYIADLPVCFPTGRQTGRFVMYKVTWFVMYWGYFQYNYMHFLVGSCPISAKYLTHYLTMYICILQIYLSVFRQVDRQAGLWCIGDEVCGVLGHFLLYLYFLVVHKFLVQSSPIGVRGHFQYKSSIG